VRIFLERKRAREHVKSKHRDKLNIFSHNYVSVKLKNLKKQGIDPENRLLDASLNTQINTRVALTIISMWRGFN